MTGHMIVLAQWRIVCFKDNPRIVAFMVIAADIETNPRSRSRSPRLSRSRGGILMYRLIEHVPR